MCTTDESFFRRPDQSSAARPKVFSAARLRGFRGIFGAQCNPQFPDVCPTALVDPVCMSITGAQSNAKDYGIDLTNEDARRDLLGFHMTLSDTLEAFDIVMSTRNAYERHEMEKIEQSSKKSG